MNKIYLGEMLTSTIHGFRFSSNITSNPNNSWTEYFRLTFPLTRTFICGSPLYVFINQLVKYSRKCKA